MLHVKEAFVRPHDNRLGRGRRLLLQIFYLRPHRLFLRSQLLNAALRQLNFRLQAPVFPSASVIFLSQLVNPLGVLSLQLGLNLIPNLVHCFATQALGHLLADLVHFLLRFNCGQLQKVK